MAMTKIRQPGPSIEERVTALLDACIELMHTDAEATLAAAAEHLPNTPTEDAVRMLTETATSLRQAVRSMVEFALTPEQRWQLARPLLRRAEMACLGAVRADRR